MQFDKVLANIKTEVKHMSESRDYAELVNVPVLMQFMGYTAILLPIVVYGVHLVDTQSIAPLGSISEYYHTGSRNIFVGMIFAISIFLIVYKGFATMDNVLSSIAGISAIGVALLPTGCDDRYDYCSIYCGSQWCEQTTILHFVCAGIFFSILAIFCLFIFTKNNDGEKRQDKYNRIYRWSGWSMVVFMALILLYAKIIDQRAPEGLVMLRPIYFLETFSLVAFGFSWLTKAKWMEQEYLPKKVMMNKEAV